MSKKKLPFLLLCLLFIPAILFFFYSVRYYKENRCFVNYTNKIFCREVCQNTLNLHYTLASPKKFGITDYPITFGDASVEALRENMKLLQQYQTDLSEFSPKYLCRENRLTYDILSSYFDTQIDGLPFLLYYEPLGPTTGTQAQLPVLLAEYAFRDLADIKEYFQLLSKIDLYYLSILDYEQAKSEVGLFMSDENADRIIAQCSDFIHAKENFLIPIFEEKLDAFPELSKTQKEELTKTHNNLIRKHVIPTYRLLIKGLSDLKGTGKNTIGLAGLPNGRKYYEHLVRQTTGSSLSIPEMEQRILKQLRLDFAELETLAKKHPEVLSNRTLSSPHRDPEEILQDLKKKMSKDFPKPPEVECQIKYVPSSLKDYLSPAFYLTPPLDSLSSNVIYINPGTNYTPLDLYTTLAHEGYPGHLYQSVYSGSASANPVRSLLNFGGYVEGWATYVEMYSYSLSDTDPSTAALYRLNRSITLGLSSLLDIAIHSGGCTRNQVISYLSQLGFQDRTMAVQLYDQILESPANYLKYYVGYLSFLDLRNEMQEKQKEDFDLKAFHRSILEIGEAPFDILSERIVG